MTICLIEYHIIETHVFIYEIKHYFITQNTSFCDAYLLISAIGGSDGTVERRKQKDGDGMPPSVVNVYAPQPADYMMLSSHRGKSWQQPRVMHQTAL